MKNFYREVSDLLQNNENIAVATVFNKIGSAPRAAGAKMLVQSSGAIHGTIGGGRLEAEAIRLSQKALPAKQSFIQSFDLTGTDAAAMGMICGGKGEVLIDFLDAGDSNNRQVYAAAADVVERKEKAWLVTMLTVAPGTDHLIRNQCLVKPDRTLVGKIDCDPYILEKLIAGPAKIAIHAEIIADQRFLVEPLRPAGTVYIFGAGHVSQCIAPLSENVGFKTVILDDRADYANRQRFPEAAEIMVIASFDQLPQLAIDGDSYLVIVTRGHLYDRIVLEQILRSDAGYIGMIGSRSKRDQVFKELLAQGYEKEKIDRIHAPIGTDIGAETPEELAVSIVGELIQVRAKRERVALKQGESKGACCKLIRPDAL